jgi:hypothetical protein
MNKYEKAAVYLRGCESQHVETGKDSLWITVWKHHLSSATDIRVHEEQVDEFSAEYDTDPDMYDQLAKEFLKENT